MRRTTRERIRPLSFVESGAKNFIKG